MKKVAFAKFLTDLEPLVYTFMKFDESQKSWSTDGPTQSDPVSRVIIKLSRFSTSLSRK